MTVRWKPLLILSGVFVTLALVGLFAIAMVIFPKGVEGTLAKARTELKAKKFKDAEIYYKEAHKLASRKPEFQLEFADFYAQWLPTVDAADKARVMANRFTALKEAARFGPSLAEPRRILMAEAIELDDNIDAAYWAKELLNIEAADAVANYVVAAEAAEAAAPNTAEIKRRLETLEKAKPRTVKNDWIAVRLAQTTNDDAKLKEILGRVRNVPVAAGMSSLDRVALLRLRAVDVHMTTNPDDLAPRVEALGSLAKAITDDPAVPSSRVARTSLLIETAQKDLAQVAATSDAAGKARIEKLNDGLETVAESIFRKATADGRAADLGVYLTYADHLRFRDKREKCLEVVQAAFKSPLAEKQKASEAAQGLHALAVESILGDSADKSRYEKVAPHIKSLIEGPNKRFQALGHLFQGAIDLEFAGVDGEEAAAPKNPAESAKLRVSALSHLKIAATDLPDLAEAQARYGVALIISREVALGRQYLQKALRTGALDVQYLIWAAWSMVQGGYPEDAQPIVDALLADVEAGKRPKALGATLHLLSAEIHQARRSPEELRKAIAEYTRSFQLGQKQTPAIHLRLAQIEIMLNRPADALKRIDAMTGGGFGSAGAEQLAVLTLQEMGKTDDAKSRLAAALAKFPKSADLASLNASILVRDGKAAEADKALEAFLKDSPDNLSIVQTRAQILAEALKKPEEARALLTKFAETCDASAPLVQLALIDLQAARFDDVAATAEKLRTRWKEAAAADLIDAQLSLAKGNGAQASKHFDAALKKDPGNKIVQYWKAQLDGRVDPNGAAKVFQSLVDEAPIKEIDENLSLTTASQSALANLAMESGDIDGAISRYEGLLKQGAKGSIARGVRWQLVAAHNAKREWPAAKAEIVALLSDAQNPPLDAERIKAATYYRMNGEAAEAERLLDGILAGNPSNPAAVVVRAEMLAGENKNAEALALIGKAIEASTDRKKIPPVFFLVKAAIENVAPPAQTGLKRAMAALDEGLALQPDSLELVQAKCKVITLTESAAAAATFVEGKAKADPKGPWRRLLVVIHRDQQNYAGAERVTAELLKENPNDVALTTQLVRFVASQAIEAQGKGDEAAVAGLNLRTANLIEAARKRFPDDATFVQLDCELAARKGEFTKAIGLTRQVDQMTNNSATGSLLRAQIQAVQGRTREVAASYAEALARNPRQPEVRLQLAKASMSIGDRDEALRQTAAVLEIDPDQPRAILIQAQALANEAGSETQVRERRAKAMGLLAKAVAKTPNFAEAHHLMADIHLKSGDKAKAVEALRLGLKNAPGDAGGLSLLIRVLADPQGGRGPAAAELADAKAVSDALGEKDKTGNMWLAAAVGFHKTGQLDLALPYAEKAAARMAGNPVVHLNYGDLLLSLAEGSSDPVTAKGFFEKAVAEYDKVLKVQPTSLEAVNNKAWILHSYLNRSQEALELAKGVVAKVDPGKLPAEFYDTVGTIQLAMGQIADAEESFNKGLRKSPELAVLNFHMGKLMSSDQDKRKRAVPYLRKADAARDQLSPSMVAEVAALLEKSGG